MNPLEILEVLESKHKQTIRESGQYDFPTANYINTELTIAYDNAKKAINAGEFIFVLESIDGEQIKVNDKEFSMSKLMTDENKHILFLQALNVSQEDWNNTDASKVAEDIKKAINKTSNIEGALLLPPNFDLSLLTAKLNASTNFFSQQNIFDTEEFEQIKRDITKYRESMVLGAELPSEKYIGEPVTPEILKTILKELDSLYKAYRTDFKINFFDMDFEDYVNSEHGKYFRYSDDKYSDSRISLNKDGTIFFGDK